jgi:hypothetical protein
LHKGVILPIAEPKDIAPLHARDVVRIRMITVFVEILLFLLRMNVLVLVAIGSGKVNRALVSSKVLNLLVLVLIYNGAIVIHLTKLHVILRHSLLFWAVNGHNSILVKLQKLVKLLDSVMIGNLATHNLMVSVCIDQCNQIVVIQIHRLVMECVLTEVSEHKISVSHQMYGEPEQRRVQNV